MCAAPRYLLPPSLSSSRRLDLFFTLKPGDHAPKTYPPPEAPSDSPLDRRQIAALLNFAVRHLSPVLLVSRFYLYSFRTPTFSFSTVPLTLEYNKPPVRRRHPPMATSQRTHVGRRSRPHHRPLAHPYTCYLSVTQRTIRYVPIISDFWSRCSKMYITL
jgi:hypothetical protein